MTSQELPSRPNHVLEDPGATAIARVYAKAFLDAAGPRGEQELLEEFTSFHDDVLQKHPEFAELLTSGAVSRDDKRGILERTVVRGGSPMFVSFLRVLARHDRLDILPAVLDQAWKEHERRANRRRVKVASSRPLSDSQLAEVREVLQKQWGFEPLLQPVVDPALLGGLLIQVGDTVYDSSLRTRFRNLRSKLRQRCLNEIQSGRDRFSHSAGN